MKVHLRDTGDQRGGWTLETKGTLLEARGLNIEWRCRSFRPLRGAHHSKSVRDHHTNRTCVKHVQIARGYMRATGLHGEGKLVHEGGHIHLREIEGAFLVE